MAHTILELPEIPRERDKLKAVIGQARYEMRKSRIIRYTSYAIIGLAVLLLLMNGCSGPAASPIDLQTIHLPIVAR
jgi:hypothetical protein